MSRSGGKKPPLVADRRYPKKKKTPQRKPASKRKRAPARRKRAPKRGFFGRLFHALVVRPLWALLRLCFRLGLTFGVVIALLVGAGVAIIMPTLPPIEEMVDARTRGSVTLLDRHGQVFAWRGDQFGGPVTAGSVAPVLKNAVVAVEDKRFYNHFGLSPRGIASAIRINMREGRGPLSGNGGSTITQQTAKLLCLGVVYDPTAWKSEAAYEADCRRTTLWRKVKEATYALALEVKYSKDEILTIYLNRAYLGAGARGFEAASQRYFGKSAKQVSAAEAAMLAGLLKAPSAYAPTNNLSRAQTRANLIVGLMHDQGYLNDKQAHSARTNPATLSKAAAAKAGGHFADWVMGRAPDFLTHDTTEDVVIRSTLDPKLQRAAEEALAHVFDTKVRAGSKAQAAIVVMSADGAVRAMVGGRDTRTAGAFNRATQAKRQTGSAFKPFVYAVAMDLGFTPNATVVDEPHCINVRGSGRYCPKNYTKNFAGRVTLTQALAQSLNIPAVKISEDVGRANVRRVASDFGIQSSMADGPALALGVSESTLIEMTGAYAGILNGGRSVTPYGLVSLRLQGDKTPLIGQDGGMGERVISKDAAENLVYMMHQVIESGTGRRARLSGRAAAGKTGTTQAARDAWFIGFTADYVAGVWMGYDDNTPLTGVTGGGLPADIWRETMARVHKGLPARTLPMQVPRAVPVDSTPQSGNPSRRQRNRDRTERILQDVLGDILRGDGD